MILDGEPEGGRPARERSEQGAGQLRAPGFFVDPAPGLNARIALRWHRPLQRGDVQNLMDLFAVGSHDQIEILDQNALDLRQVPAGFLACCVRIRGRLRLPLIRGQAKRASPYFHVGETQVAGEQGGHLESDPHQAHPRVHAVSSERAHKLQFGRLDARSRPGDQRQIPTQGNLASDGLGESLHHPLLGSFQGDGELEDEQHQRQGEQRASSDGSGNYQ